MLDENFPKQIIADKISYFNIFNNKL